MNPSATANLSQQCVKPVELDFDCAIRNFAPKRKEQLPASFQPSPDSVIIGKGKMPAQASGNKRLRILVEAQLENYANAKFKRDKTYIVTNILHSVQEACKVGAFAKFDGERWWEVSDRISREKIACMFRDSLSGQYKSSNKNKVAKRRALRAKQRSAAAARSVPPPLPMIVIPQAVSYSCLPSSQTSEPALHRGSFKILEGLDLGCLMDNIDRTVFDSTVFFDDYDQKYNEAASIISSDEGSFAEIEL